MKTHKLTMFISFSISIIMLGVSLYSAHLFGLDNNLTNHWISTHQNICIGLMTSAAVTGFVSLALYINTKNLIISQIYNSLQSIYSGLNYVKIPATNLLILIWRKMLQTGRGNEYYQTAKEFF